MSEEKVKCNNCGKAVYWFDLGDHTNSICYNCIEKMNRHPILWKWYKVKTYVKKRINFISVIIVKVILLLIFFAFMYVWVISCIGNALNVDEDPAPGLHWKPDTKTGEFK